MYVRTNGWKFQLGTSQIFFGSIIEIEMTLSEKIKKDNYFKSFIRLKYFD